MKLLQRVSALIRANVNDLLDRAEDPEKMIKQLIIDLNNQLIQVKTAVAQALADQHLLEKRLASERIDAEKWQRRAELAVDNEDDTLARAALEKHNSFVRTSEETEKQLEEQRKEAAALKEALSQLDIKIAEVTRQRDVVLARQRRANVKEQLARVKSGLDPNRLEELIADIEGYVDRAEASAEGHRDLSEVSPYRRIEKIEHEKEISDQLNSLKAKRKGTTAPQAPAQQ